MSHFTPNNLLNSHVIPNDQLLLTFQFTPKKEAVGGVLCYLFLSLLYFPELFFLILDLRSLIVQLECMPAKVIVKHALPLGLS